MKSTICVRLSSEVWGAAVVLMLTGVVLGGVAGCAPPNPLTWPAALTLGGALFLPGLFAAIWALRRTVTADETGLSFVRFWKKTQTPWKQIGDFYTVPINATRDKNEMRLRPNAFVLDQNGAIIASFRLNARNAPALCEMISHRAVCAKTQTWQMQGTRPFDPLPRVFGYNPSANRLGRGLLVCVALLLAAVCTGATVFLILKSLARHDFGWWTIGMAGFPWVLSGLYLALFFISYKAGESQIRTGEAFTIDTEGFVFCAPARFERVLWRDVTGYGYAPAPLNTDGSSGFAAGLRVLPCRITTAHQGDFEFTHALTDCLVFKEIIRLRADYSGQTDWPTPQTSAPQTLGSETLRWSGKQAGKGDQIFHYRTTTSRAFVWLAAVFPAMGVILRTLAHFDLVRADNANGGAILLCVFSPLLILSVWRYYAAQIHVGETGITQKTPWGTTFIAWADVKSVQTESIDPFGAFVQSTTGKTIRWTPDFIAGKNELNAALAARVYPVTNRQQTGAVK